MTRNIIPASEYRQLLVSDHPMMDVRAPVEFIKGAFPGSTNLPLMVDSERQKVGTCYKEQGQQAAIELGHSLVCGKIKQQRIDAWLGYFAAKPQAYLYCFRGGLRSQLTQQWLEEAGMAIPYIQGGYKAMRQYLIEVIDAAPRQKPICILSGITGSGKTELLQQRSEAVDLEGIANHRGSSFGKNVTPQPSQINFENGLAVALLKHQDRNGHCLLLEDESFLIGRNAIPKPFYESMQDAPILVLEESDELRLPRLLRDYVQRMHADYVARLGEEAGFEAFSQYLLLSIDGVKKRLGGKLHGEFQQLIARALAAQLQRNDISLHLEWISLLLEKYYDPMYLYQLQQKQPRVIFSGDRQAIHEWLDERANS
ncbi:tRNA 2-selenouridine(34) synthase MnmH [Shewanella sp. AS16]|uniref:tRNA 2-selenouridine(34) synthase MnmH n=1 Tax=Shewanella sp. AS16 TaxID=2907625 RepID=UPI001F1A61D6|nr:tRNA 2-selenouridine(34) synthase MnmH [Shewanella sp. AS16]MCE9687831.1 tRNA 2-selenouridine(34) synthase MnmH [Shewanella sp. AS16]